MQDFQSEQADNGLAAARVHLDDGVALCARFIPFVQNIALHIAQIGVFGGLRGQCLEELLRVRDGVRGRSACNDTVIDWHCLPYIPSFASENLRQKLAGGLVHSLAF